MTCSSLELLQWLFFLTVTLFFAQMLVILVLFSTLSIKLNQE